MEVHFCKESINWAMSPRISFSHNLTLSNGNESNAIPVDSHRPDPHTDPSSDFDFCIFERSDHESSTADELFSEGRILPLENMSPIVVQPPPPEPTSSPSPQHRKEESLREIVAEEPPKTRLFCFFRRSSSLNSGNGCRSSSIWSRQLLSRSNSTGSTGQNQKNLYSRDNQKTFVQKRVLNSDSNAFPTSLSSSSLQKPPSKKNSSMGKAHFGSYGNGVHINPVLNVPSPCISRGTSLFGFGFFCNHRKDRKSRNSLPSKRSVENYTPKITQTSTRTI